MSRRRRVGLAVLFIVVVVGLLAVAPNFPWRPTVEAVDEPARFSVVEQQLVDGYLGTLVVVCDTETREEFLLYRGNGGSGITRLGTWCND